MASAADPAVRVQRPATGNEIAAPERLREGLPTLKDRARIFTSAGLDAETEGMDQYLRDKLFLRARVLDLKDLSGKYPKIPAAKLKKLKAAVLGGGEGA